MSRPKYEESLACGDCGSPMILRSSKYGQFYGCTTWPDCPGSHGAHADGTPMGTPADAATRAARVATHLHFDRLWRPGSRGSRARRRRCYAWLATAMGLTESECHIGRFTVAQCAEADRLLSASQERPR